MFADHPLVDKGRMVSMAVRTLLYLELTQRCNFKCTFCRSVRRQNNAVLDFDMAIQCLDEMKNRTVHGVYLNTVQFNGNGEALLYPQLDQVIVEAKKRFLSAEFVTNGSLLTKERIEKLLETDIDMIEISLTGVVPEVYKNFQGSGIPYRQCVKQLETVISNIRMLVRKRDEMHKKTYIRLRYIRSRKLGSYWHFKDYLNYWRDSGVDEIFVTALWEFNKKPLRTKRLKVTRCQAMNKPMKINADGSVFTCGNNLDMARYAHGNVYHTPLAEIISSDSFVLDKANKMTCDINCVPKTCLSCEFRTFRSFREELSNRRMRVFLKKPVKTFFYKPLGLAYIIWERMDRMEWFHKIFWNYMCRKSRDIHEKFQKENTKRRESSNV